MQKKNQIAEFEGKAFAEQKPRTTYENVQHILDLRIDQLKKELVDLEEQVKEYDDMK